MMNKVILVGRLAAEPELKVTQKGDYLATLRVVANTYGGRDDEGNAKERSEFFNLVVFGKTAEVAAKYLHKGRLIFAEGRLQTRTWDDAEGKKHWKTEVAVENLQMLGPRTDERTDENSDAKTDDKVDSAA